MSPSSHLCVVSPLCVEPFSGITVPQVGALYDDMGEEELDTGESQHVGETPEMNVLLSNLILK